MYKVLEKVLITGASGDLGKTLKKLFENNLTPNRTELDITEPPRVWDYFSANLPQLVIHCAAMTDVTECEKEPLEAYHVNGFGTYTLVDVCETLDIPLIYISTDHVFDGKKGNYSEKSVPNPTTHYGKSKLMGEWYTLTNPKNLVIRTSFMKNFPFERAYTDKYFSAERIEVVAAWIYEAVQLKLKGLYHIANDRKSVFDLARLMNSEVKRMVLQSRPKNKAGIPYLKDTSLNSAKWRAVR